MRISQGDITEGHVICRFVSSMSLLIVTLLLSTAVSVPDGLADPGQVWPLEAKPRPSVLIASPEGLASRDNLSAARGLAATSAGLADPVPSEPELPYSIHPTSTVEISAPMRISSSYQVKMHINSNEELEELRSMGVDAEEIGDVTAMIPVSSYEISQDQGYNLSLIKQQESPLCDEAGTQLDEPVTLFSVTDCIEKDGNQYEESGGDVGSSSEYPNGVVLSPGSLQGGWVTYRFYLPYYEAVDYTWLRVGFWGKDTSWLGSGPDLGLYDWTTDTWNWWTAGKDERYYFLSFPTEDPDFEKYIGPTYDNVVVQLTTAPADESHIDYVDSCFTYNTNDPPNAPVFKGVPANGCYPTKSYNVTVDYTDPNGASDLQYVYVRLAQGNDEQSYRQTLVWGLSGSPSQWNDETPYLYDLSATETSIADGYRVTWSFKVNWDWHESTDVDLWAWGSDQQDVESNHAKHSAGWDYDPDIRISSSNENEDPVDEGKDYTVTGDVGFEGTSVTPDDWSGISVEMHRHSTSGPLLDTDTSLSSGYSVSWNTQIGDAGIYDIYIVPNNTNHQPPDSSTYWDQETVEVVEKNLTLGASHSTLMSLLRQGNPSMFTSASITTIAETQTRFSMSTSI